MKRKKRRIRKFFGILGLLFLGVVLTLAVFWLRGIHAANTDNPAVLTANVDGATPSDTEAQLAESTDATEMPAYNEGVTEEAPVRVVPTRKKVKVTVPAKANTQSERQYSFDLGQPDWFISLDDSFFQENPGWVKKWYQKSANVDDSWVVLHRFFATCQRMEEYASWSIFNKTIAEVNGSQKVEVRTNQEKTVKVAKNPDGTEFAPAYRRNKETGKLEDTGGLMRIKPKSLKDRLEEIQKSTQQPPSERKSKVVASSGDEE